MSQRMTVGCKHSWYGADDESLDWGPVLQLKVGKPWGGGTHILRHMRMCCSNGLLFHKKSVNMDPIFYKISLNMGPFFKNFKNFPMFAIIEHPKIVKNGPLFKKKKALQMGTLFYQNDPYKWVGVSRLERHTTLQTKSEYPLISTWPNPRKWTMIVPWSTGLVDSLINPLMDLQCGSRWWMEWLVNMVSDSEAGLAFLRVCVPLYFLCTHKFQLMLTITRPLGRACIHNGLEISHGKSLTMSYFFHQIIKI